MMSELIFKAATFSANAHCHQKRRYHNMPYINHLIRVADNANSAKLSSEAIAAAFLHDVVEDTPVELVDLKSHFPDRVVQLVHLLTKWWPDQSSGDEITLYKLKYYTEISKDTEAICLKLLDRADNVFDFISSLPESYDEARNYLESTHKEFPFLLQKCENSFVREKFNTSISALAQSLK